MTTLTRADFDERMRLYETAMALPVPSDDDFIKLEPPSPEQRANLRKILDRDLRNELVNIGMAEVLQVPRGRQQIPSIIRIRPSMDAPKPRVKAGLLVKPSVEELRELVARVRRVEAGIGAEQARDLDTRIASLRRAVATADGDSLERAVNDLRTLLAVRRDIAGRARAEALRMVAADPTFEPGRFIDLISDEVSADAPLPIASPMPAAPMRQAPRPFIPAAPRPFVAQSRPPQEPPVRAMQPVRTIDNRERFAGKPVDPRRDAYRKEWDAKLLPLLSREWQSTFSLAYKLHAKNATILERLKDMMARELVERRVVRQPAKPLVIPPGKRVRFRKRRGILEAQFRLKLQSAAGQRT